MTVHVFSGPSTAGSPVLSSTGVCWHPPVVHGNLYRLALAPGDAVLIVDGLYQHRAPVRHKEILSLCSAGVPVYGAASIGALRASELSGLGMSGLGRVFGWYRDGRLNSDADVALVHGDADVGFRAFTHAIVSVLDVCENLLSAGQLDAQAVSTVMDIARSVHFTERSTDALLAAAAKCGQEPVMRAVTTALADPDNDVKRRDAEAAIRTVLAASSVPSDSGKVPEVPVTSFGRDWRLRHAPASDEPGAPTRRELLAYAQLFLPDFPDRHTRYVLAHLIPEHPSVAEGGHSPKWLAGLVPEELVRRGLLTADEVSTLAPAERDLRVLIRSFRLRSGRLVYEDLPAGLLADHPGLAGECAQLLSLNGQAALAYPLFLPAQLSASMIAAAFSELWRTADLPTELLDRGFRDMDDFLVQARPFYVAAMAAVGMNNQLPEKE